MKRKLLSLLLLALFPLTSLAAEYAELHYPIEEHRLKKEAGTIEMWILPEADFEETTTDFYRFFIFRVSLGEKIWGDQAAVGLFWRPRGGLVLSANEKGTTIPGLPSDRSGRDARGKLEKGKWSHVAVTWQHTDLKVYVDGEKILESTAERSLPLKGEKGFFLPGFGKSKLAVGEVCVTSRTLSDQEIRERFEKGFEALPETIILDHMAPSGAEVGTRKLFKPEFSRVVPGRTPSTTALRLFVEED